LAKHLLAYLDMILGGNNNGVTHVDLATNGERLAVATKILREFAAESRHDAGNIQRL